MNKVHPTLEAVPSDNGYWSLGMPPDTNKGEPPAVTEEGDTKSDNEGAQKYLWDRWVIEIYPLVSLQKVKIYLDGIRVLCLRWWKKKVIHGMFRWL